MSRTCSRQTTGGKGNLGSFIARDPKVCAAGIPSSQPNLRVADCLRHYLVQEEVDALIHDAIIPPPKPRRLPPLRHESSLDMRNAGPFNEGAELLSPPVKTKFQTLVDDFKATSYSSYWRKNIGKLPDQVPALPEGFDIYGTTLGKKTPFYGRLYDIVMPIEPVPDTTSPSKRPGYQLDRNYCKPGYQSHMTFGMKSNIDTRGKLVKCCLTDDRVLLGTNLNKPLTTRQADFLNGNQSRLGVSLAPNDNISCIPQGHTFGLIKPPASLSVSQCLTMCELNPSRELFKQCLGHLNTLRKCLFKRFEHTFFDRFYLSLKYLDEDKTGWLPKQVIFKCCANNMIRFDPALVEPLLSLWNAFDGSRIEYKTFVHVINSREPTLELPKIPDIPYECIDFRTTYSEIVKTDNKVDTQLMAGTPSGRYLDLYYPVTPDGCCKADRAYLPQESDAKACLNPSVYTLLGVSHRDMYTNRKPDIIRKVFEAAGENFTDDNFDAVWQHAKKYHSQGWVCFETFRRALDEIKLPDIPI